MRKQTSTRKPLHQHIMKEAQLADALDALMTQVTHPQQLTSLSESEIKRIAGSSSFTSKQLQATLQLANLFNVPERQLRYSVRLPRDVVQYCRDNIGLSNDRGTYLLGLNTKNMITTTECIPEETMQSLTTYQRAVFRHLIIHKCASGILVHWHDGGSINPSQGEVSLVKQIADASDTVGIAILDAIVLSERDFFSFKEHGLI